MSGAVAGGTAGATHRVSVALCTYDGARWLGPFLDGLLAQTLVPYELVVSDDGSGDATLDLLAAFAGRAPFPVRVEQTPRRLGSTMNFGVAFGRCTGDLVASADQDDVWRPEKLAHLAAAMDERDLALAFSDGTVIDDAGTTVDTTLWAGVGFGPDEQRRFDRDPLGVLVRRSVVTGAAMVLRAEHLDRLLPFPPALDGPASPMLQDRWAALVLASIARVGRVAEPLIEFRRHESQQTGLREPLTAGEVAHQLRRSSASSAQAFTTRADQLDAVRARVRGAAHPGVEDRLAAAVAHLRARASLSPGRARRVVSVGRELLVGRYGRYSGGVRSAVADLTRPAGYRGDQIGPVR